MQTEKMQRISKNSMDDVYCISRYLYQRYSNIFWGYLDGAVGRGDGYYSAKRCCRGPELESHDGS